MLRVRWHKAENSDEFAKASHAVKSRVNVKVEPISSSLFFAYILPPRASIMLLETNNPRPVPVWDLLVNFVKSLGIISESIPMPFLSNY
jgi:hypothetical protein